MLKYQEVQSKIIEDIQKQEFKPNEYLPTEQVLCVRYGVSRVTVRRAINELENKGILVRYTGRGVLIKQQNKVNQRLSCLTSFTEDMIAQNMKPDSRILLNEKTHASKEIAEKLRINDGDEVFVLRRLRLADDEPMAIETIYVGRESIFPYMEKFSGQSFYLFLQEELGIIPVKAFQTIEISELKEWEAILLGNRDMRYSLRIYRQTFDATGNPIEFVVSQYRGDRYRFHAELFNREYIRDDERGSNFVY